MKIAVISDIHGNMDAFEQVLADIDKTGIETVISLGDNIGYGPEPEQVVLRILDRGIPSVMGNHEWAIADRAHLNWFNPVAKISLTRTRQMLSETAVNFLCGLERSMIRHKCRFVHGFPPHSLNNYLFQVSDHDIRNVLKDLSEKICFVGHTHDLEIIGYDGETVYHASFREGITALNRNHHYIINIGSVGQPRDGNNNAKYVVWDDLDYTLDLKYVPYDIAATVEKIHKAGLPETHAARLW